MKWCRISTGTESVQVATDEIVYIRADDNYSDFVLTNDKAKCRAIVPLIKSITSAPATRKPFGFLSMPFANTASSIPSTSLTVPVMYSIKISMVLGMT